MPIKYVPFIPEPVEGQAVLGNFNRILRYKGADDVSMTLQRGMPLYEMEKQETVGENADGNMVIRGESVSACAYLKEQGTNETSGGGGSYNKEPPLFFCVENEDVLIFLKEGYRNPTGFMIIPELSEPPVRTLGATIPENESHIFR